MSTVNDTLLRTLLQKDFDTFFRIINDRKLEYEGDLLFRVGSPQDASSVGSSNEGSELVGFCVRIKISNLPNLAKMVTGFHQSRIPIEILAIVSKDGEEKYQPLG